ncbi:phosphopantothenoylcysteine decarboxylase/phosphopantothenate--cysteine ligase [Kibdelosporangium banguiense]|uniref:Phosphopantothenoylcysteine decarboxylase/phosphopantothenate--cysteine ligase n=1 Tax=Kibdelosporangium banguiense TaxID=1365924 RepID=A0ABS4TZ08_9PSEU|nr:flavoprotein [Kibdelosporangium banguiense]MBP2329637.1 phosphopantothenoylcysteine decarboxylase/phosphopantothenate--cysteine ligase [Kibdelosporangium banguiense]
MREDALVVVAGGSSASLVLAAYLSELRRTVDDEIVVLLTKSAERFMPSQVAGWLADEVLTADLPDLNPVEVALKAKAMVVLPATAHLLACAALGLASTPATTALLASPRPALWFPHMNKAMWGKPVIQRHVADLRESGETVVEPETREVYEIWRGERSPGVSMIGPDKAAAVVRDWLGVQT